LLAPDQDSVPQVQLPPVPELPPLPRTASPPTAVIGVMGVPEVMRASTAAQLVDRVIGERREKLNQDAQTEQAAWRDLQQQLSAQRSTMSPEQIRTKERELQERITNAQKQFRERNRIIQEAAQYGVGQIERMLVAVIRQVAESRGMNLVLHRAQVALNVNEFDITDQVAQQLNKIMPTVTIPPDGVSPSTLPVKPAPTTPAAPAPAAGPRR
jgi:Skp family chaperone for outer membrane proteins